MFVGGAHRRIASGPAARFRLRAMQTPPAADTPPRPSTPALRVYARPFDPREHPDDLRRAVQPPSWTTFGGRPQFTCLRSFELEGDRLVGIARQLELYVNEHRLGRVIWPSYPVLFASNLDELIDEVLRRELFLFDVWGYVPGCGPGGYWQELHPAREVLQRLEKRLGERWLGTDIGEQDGRYLHGYAHQVVPAGAERREQYLHFQRHFERMGDDLGHRHATLVSLNFGHYLLREGTFTLIGAETAQALPNNQVYYAFIRGAGKQYGVPWFGNASVWNRWGFKRYGAPGVADGWAHSPTKGTSLSLLKRLLYTHLLYDCMLVGFEDAWLHEGKLTPVGRIQQAAQAWTEQHGRLGTMHTPVALLLDFFAGWTFPRHLYSERIFRVWGNLPYEEGDYLTDAVLNLLYPGYRDASYFHDETGFNTPTPFGDIADCLLSDAPEWLLARYAVVVAAGRLGGGAELRDKLDAYVRGGGHLVITAGNLSRLPGGLGGRVTVERTETIAHGAGKLTLIASAFGVCRVREDVAIQSSVDAPLASPFALEPEMAEQLTAIFAAQRLFAVTGEGLSVVTCRRAPGEYTVGMANNTWREQRFRIDALCGELIAVGEMPTDLAERVADGFAPESVDTTQLGVNSATTIAGGDIRLFALTIRERGVVELAPPPPPARPRDRWLTLRSVRSLQEEVLTRPTFFQHFDGVVIDWSYCHEREAAALTKEARWLARRKLRVIVDASSGFNLYPTLTLLDNLPERYATSRMAFTALLDKMVSLGSSDLIVSLHRAPEANFPAEQTNAGFRRGLQDFADLAHARGIMLHLRVGYGKPPASLEEAIALLDAVDRSNLKLAPALALLLAAEAPSAGTPASLGGKLGLWLVAAPRRDPCGVVYDAHGPLHDAGPRVQERASVWLQRFPAPRACDAVLVDADAEYYEARMLAQL